jgi:hypothetical protein
VQLPCPEGESVKELADVRCPFDTECMLPSFFCAPDTCVFGEHSRVGPGGVCPFNSCGMPSVERFGARRIIVDPELLPVLKEKLEAQLKHIEVAEEELRKRGSGDQ